MNIRSIMNEIFNTLSIMEEKFNQLNFTDMGKINIENFTKGLKKILKEFKILKIKNA
ncbi:hypothetical protein ACFL5P_01380 [candidate division KSB1 bacterium]